MPGSGKFWQIFWVAPSETAPSSGDIRARTLLDYEDPDHRQGFRFMVQVTDQVNIIFHGSNY